MEHHQLTLISQEGDELKVDLRIAEMSGHIKDMLDEKETIEEKVGEPIHLPSIPTTVLKQIIEYCQHFNFNKNPFIPYPLPQNNLANVLTDKWEADFIGKYDLDGKIVLLKAANYLNHAAIFELCCASIGAEFRGKSFDQVKKDFGLEDVNYTPEDDIVLQEQYPWIMNEAHKKVAQLEGGPPIKKQQ